MADFKLTPLPYADDALEPVISATTIGIHHGKHLQAYVNNLNALIAGTALDGATLEDIVRHSEGAVFNNAGQILNHNMYFAELRAPRTENLPTGRIAEAISRQFGSFDAFRKEFQQKGSTLFGSGWVWLSADADGSLVITQEANAGNPLTRGLTPLLTIDVWEHAYYLDYQNRRPDYLSAFWSLIDWDEINRRMEQR